MKRTIPLVIVLAGILQNCAPSRYVKPLKKDATCATFSFGGPMIGFAGTWIPIPFTTAGYAKGITGRLTGYAHLHTTSLLFGNLQTDVGVTYGLLDSEKKFGISAAPSLQQAFSMRHRSGFRIWPSMDLNAYYQLSGRGSYLYGGVSSWFELSATRAHGEPSGRRMTPNLHAGYTIVRNKWNHQLELKYLGLGIPVLPGVVDYKGINGKGSMGIYYAVSRFF